MKILKIHCPHAMSIDGTYLEDVVDGYMTLGVAGREDLQYETKSKDIGNLDGSLYLSRRLPSRTLKVSYRVVIDPGKEDGRTPHDVINKLNRLTEKEEAHLGFADDMSDGVAKYYIGTRTKHEIKSINDNVIYGGFEFYCADPLKYSAVLKSTTAKVVNKNGKSVYQAIVNNSGTAAAPIDYKITCKSTTAYLGIVSHNGVMQFGTTDPDRNETGTETLLTWSGMNDGFINLARAGENNARHPNDDIPTRLQLKVVNDSRYGWSKSVVLDLENGAQDAIDTSEQKNAVCGTLTAEIPEDSTHDIDGSANFYCSMNHTFATGDVGQTGWLAISFLDKNKNYICGYEITKPSMSENIAYYYCVIQNKVVRQQRFAPTIWNTDNPLNPPRGPNDLRKEGGKITFHMWGKYYTHNVPGLANSKVKYIQIAIAQSTRWGEELGRIQARLRKQQADYEAAQEAYDALDSDAKKGKKPPVDPQCTQDPDWNKTPMQKCQEMLIPEMAVRNLRFDKLGVSYKTTNSKFKSGDVLLIKGDSSRFYWNNVYRPEEEALGTEYFKAEPGQTAIEFQTPADAIRPEIVVSWREAWL